MRFSYAAILAIVAAIVTANTVDFINQDSTTRTIYYTPQEGHAEIAPTTIGGLSTHTVSFPTGWIGNFYSVSEGAAVVPGMLGEVRWDGWDGVNWFDVSAIVNPNDHNGVKTLSPKGSGSPFSGCDNYKEGCDNAYYAPNDVQTKSTTEKELICTLGTAAAKTKVKVRRHPRHFITGHSAH